MVKGCQIISLSLQFFGSTRAASILGPVNKVYRSIDAHVGERLCRWLCKKHKTPGRGTARFPYEHLYQKLGLKRLSLTTRDLPWAKA